MKRKSQDGHLESLSYRELCQIGSILRCKRARTRAELVQHISSLHACRRLQRFWRRCIAVNTLCPLSQEVVVYPFAVVKLAPCKFVYYSHALFIEYIMHNFHEPSIKDPVSGSDLPAQLVDHYKHIVRLSGNAPPSPKDDALGVLDVAIDQCMSDCVHAITTGNMHMQLHNDWFVNLAYMLNMLFLVCPGTCRQKLAQCVSTCEELPAVFGLSLRLLGIVFDEQ